MAPIAAPVMRTRVELSRSALPVAMGIGTRPDGAVGAA
jgi:hypothetical protein